MKIFSLLFSLFLILSAADAEFYYDGTKKVSLKLLQTLVRSNASVYYYEDERGKKVGVSNKILVQFKHSDNIENYLAEFEATIEKDLGGNLFVFLLSNAALTIEVANTLHLKEDVLFAHPDFIRIRELR